MALKKKTTKVEAAPKAAPVRKASSAKSVRAATSGAKMTDEQKRDKILKERFCPEGVQWLKDVLNIDVTNPKVPLSVVYDIAAGNVTEPIEAVVTPLAYDKSAKKNVEMPPMKVVSSFRIMLPYDRDTFAPIPPSKEQPVFVASYPCYEFLQKSEPSEAVSPAKEPEKVAKGELPKFSPEMVMALEGVGIREDRLYANTFNAVSLADKQAMVAGDAFTCTGTVRVADGLDNRLSINVNGLAKLEQGRDGKVSARFVTQYPAEQQGNRVLDLMKVSRIGSLELDFFERDARGHRKTDVYGNPIINKAGKDLVRYGRVFGFVDGYLHQKAFKNGSWEESVQKDKYEVSVVNGGLCVSKARKVLDLDANGESLTTVIGGKEVEKYHYESRDAKVGKDGTVRVGMQDLKPATPKDLEDYRRGVGGRFVGYQAKDFKTGKKVVYDAYVFPDNRRNGYGRAFSQKVSEELFAARQEKKTARKQNYSLGL